MSGQPFAFVPVATGRSQQKPRATGRTMVIDDGLPLGVQRDLLEAGGRFVDIAKIKTGSARLYAEDVLTAKIALYRGHGIAVFPGGQFLEYVLHVMGEEAAEAFFAEAIRLGFTAVEVSDNVVALPGDLRTRLTTQAVDAGLTVFGEIGSKETDSEPQTLIAQGRQSLDAGAELLLIEAAELFQDGALRRGLFNALCNSFEPEQLMFELPGPWIDGVCHHQIEALSKLLVRELGPDVNIGNLAPGRIIDFEGTRTGLGVAGPPKGAS